MSTTIGPCSSEMAEISALALVTVAMTGWVPLGKLAT